MAVVGEVMMTPGIYRAAIKAISRKPLIRQRVVGVFVSLAGVGLLLVDNANSSGLGAGIGLAVAGLLLSLFLPTRALNMNVRYAAPVLTGVWRYQISEDGIRIRDPLVSASWPWTSVTGAVEYPEFWLLNTPLRHRSIVVAKTAFTVEGQHALADLLARMGKLAAGPGATGRPAPDVVLRAPHPSQGAPSGE